MSPQRTIALIQDFALTILVAAGLVGTLVVADDYDQLRFFAGYVGLPLAILYAAFRRYAPRTLRNWVVGTIVATNLFGIAALLNAATGEATVVKRTVERGSGLAVRDERRGGLGWTFRARF